jgi:hypothetical protein
MPLPILCARIVIGQVQAPLPTSSPDNLNLKVKQVSFSTEDGELIYTNLYGESDRGLVLAMVVALHRRAGSRGRNP